MEHEDVLYFDGSSARPTRVSLRLSGDAVALYRPEGEEALASFTLAGASFNRVGSTQFLYLDTQGLRYLQLPADHPLSGELARLVSDANPHWAGRLMKQKTAVLVALLLALAVGFYFLMITMVPFLGSRIIGVDTEIKMGDKLHQVLLSESRMLGHAVDTAGTNRLQAFADKLQLSSRYPIRLTLVKSETMNAYALPGGQVVVFSGLLQKIQTPEALAALLAHESTHVNERHSLRSLLRNAAHGIIISVLFSDATGISGALVSNADALSGLHYSRSLESEADWKGMELLQQNGVRPEGMRQLMQTLQEEGRDVPDGLSFLSSHPLTKERIRQAERYILEHPQPAGREDLQELFDALK